MRDETQREMKLEILISGVILTVCFSCKQAKSTLLAGPGLPTSIYPPMPVSLSRSSSSCIQLPHYSRSFC